MILCGDIGGTKTQLCVVGDLDRYRPEHVHTYQNVRFNCVAELLGSYLTSYGLKVDKACLSIAGPVYRGVCQMTNLPWKVSSDELQNTLGLSAVVLLNDLTATAFAIPYLPDADFHILQKGLPILNNGPIAVISIGTGLGESVLVWDDGQRRYKSLGSEGGHKDFAPHSGLEMELYSYLLSRFAKGRLSAEKLISGQGLVLIYEFLAQKKGVPVVANMTPMQINEKAHADREGLFAETVQLFFDLVASEAANVSLQYFSEGGVVIAGGIMPRLHSLFSSEKFLSRFHDKGRFDDWLKNIPIVLCKNTQAPTIGAFYFLRESSSEHVAVL